MSLRLAHRVGDALTTIRGDLRVDHKEIGKLTIDQYDRAIGVAISRYEDDKVSDRLRIQWGNLLARFYLGKMSCLKYDLSVVTQDNLEEVKAVLALRGDNW